MTHIIQITCTTILLFLCVSLAQADTTVKLGRQTISLNESVNLVISSDKSGQVDEQAMQALTKDFDISNQGKSTETSCINASCTTTHKTTYLLMPKKAGVFTIPAMTINGSKTPALQLTVKPVNNDPDKGQTDPVFVELSIDKSTVKVQQQAVLKLRINSSINLSDLQLEPIELPNVTMKELTNTNYQRQIGDTTYTTYEVAYALFPQKSEPVTIGPITVVGYANDGRQQGFNSFFNRGRRITLRSNAVTLDVEPAPKHNASEWLPAQSLNIKSDWLSDLDNVKVGDSITLEIKVSALGLTAEQLPNITIKGNSHFKAYQEQPKLENRQNEAGIIGKLTEKIAIVPNTSGDITIPAIKIQWWDVNDQSFKTAEVAAKTIHVNSNPEFANQIKLPTDANQQPNLQAPQSTPPSVPLPVSEPGGHPVWKIATALSVLLNVLLLVLYLMKRPVNTTAKPVNQTEEQPDHLQLIQQACQSKQPNTIKQALLAWAKDTWHDKQIHSLTDIARIVNTAAFTQTVKRIDTAIYQHEDVDIDFEHIRETLLQYGKPKHNNSLNELYPTK